MLIVILKGGIRISMEDKDGIVANRLVFGHSIRSPEDIINLTEKYSSNGTISVQFTFGQLDAIEITTTTVKKFSKE